MQYQASSGASSGFLSLLSWKPRRSDSRFPSTHWIATRSGDINVVSTILRKLGLARFPWQAREAFSFLQREWLGGFV